MVNADLLDRAHVESAFSTFEPRSVDLDGRRLASVVFALMRDADGTSVFPLTKRPSKMRAHPGQFALPGGSVDAGETPEEGALRELSEELGLTAATSDIIGRLDDYVTRSGFVIRPFVVWSGAEIEKLVPNPDEVASLYAVTSAELDVDPRFVSIEESPNPVVQWPFRTSLVHAPTGAVVYQLREVLSGRHTRIDNLEQPVFAWR
ncbi:CoA pyrophosphatase [Rhodococcus sp. ACPA4]|jgi:8-oxo-dGTP pyrophosphatase MutT (NUDIX family)|uniref:CoA pyrophosphatase n=1 Tax=Rhodococcus globerulus TaxID=33008 RepID=A0ABU4BZI9_RHOGO|nr:MULTISPECIES: CoA pyrophosphatase [Rhodococcus]NMD62532.1 CoA pyrophosphatase [Nocardia globerula]MCE4266577.1 CoA pyrophosphatase [Rhodococcus globerulus]MDV6269595.1 CoA pyrophosphatase [Rhodococcus globerulus]MDV8067993.1 CoA pyrophosphatase [Rhodococcus sp. IEGM 1366]NRI64800.1 CoA pyrophosphatase [Rhodococcus sp. MS16]